MQVLLSIIYNLTHVLDLLTLIILIITDYKNIFQTYCFVLI